MFTILRYGSENSIEWSLMLSRVERRLEYLPFYDMVLRTELNGA